MGRTSRYSLYRASSRSVSKRSRSSALTGPRLSATGALAEEPAGNPLLDQLADWSIEPTVDRRGAERRQAPQMPGRRVSLVGLEGVVRVEAGQRRHEGVPRHLHHDGG